MGQRNHSSASSQLMKAHTEPTLRPPATAAASFRTVPLSRANALAKLLLVSSHGGPHGMLTRCCCYA